MVPFTESSNTYLGRKPEMEPINPRGPTFFVKIAIFDALAGNVKLEFDI